MKNALQWALAHNACDDGPDDAIPWLRKHPDWTMADAWRECHRGDWMIWALGRCKLTSDLDAALRRAIERIVARAVETHALHCGIDTVEAWARAWLSGEDRSEAAARAAAGAAWAAARAAWVAAWAAAAERALQADDIRAEIPEWPGGDA